MVRRLSIKPYTQAVFEIALAEKQLDKWQSDLEEVAQLGQDLTIAAFLEDKRVPFADKLKLLSRAEYHINPLVFNLVCLLAYKGRLNMLPAIAEEYKHILCGYRGIAKAEVTTAVPLDDENSSILNEMLADVTGKSVIINNRVNPEILGGIVVNVEGKRLDGSLISRLGALKSQVVKASRDRVINQTE